MCRYCPPNAIRCLEPADEPAPRCAFCTEEPAAEDVFATAAMAAHVVGVAEHDPLCAGCARDIREDLARVACTLCDRREDPDRVDYVDVLGGTASVAVCHVCVLGVREDLDVVADRARDAWIDRMELDAELAGPLPTEGDFIPANEFYDAGDAA